MVFFLTGLAAECGRYGTALAKDVLKAIDYETLALLAGLFLVIRGIERAGIIDDLSHIITGMGGGNLFLTYTIIVWASVLISAFVDNIPFAATMVPVIQAMAQTQGVDLHVLAWALSMGTDLGGSATPIGASANVVGTSVAAKNGHPVTWGKYCRYCAPATIMVMAVSMVCIVVRYM